MSELFKADTQKHLLALGSKQHRVQELEEAQKAQNDPMKCHGELVELLKNAPKDLANELNKEEGLLSKILASSAATQAK